MGLLDFIMAERRRSELAQGRQQFQGLLSEYLPVGGGAQMSQDTGEAYQAPQTGREFDSQFFGRAAALPGYESLAGGLLSEQGAMRRQMQGQQFGMTNISAVDQARLAQQDAAQKAAQEQAAAQLAEQRFQHLNPSAYQTGLLEQGQGQLQVARGNLGVNQMQAQAQITAAQAAAQRQAYEQSPLGQLAKGIGPGTKMFDEHLAEDQQIDQTLRAVTKLQELWGSASAVPGVFDRTKMAAAGPYVNVLLGGLAKLAGSGKLDQNEAQRYTEILKRPDFFSSNKNTAAVLQELQTMGMQGKDLMRQRNPFLPAYSPPPGFK
jgi:hypothetical protein